MINITRHRYLIEEYAHLVHSKDHADQVVRGLGYEVLGNKGRKEFKAAQHAMGRMRQDLVRKDQKASIEVFHRFMEGHSGHISNFIRYNSNRSWGNRLRLWILKARIAFKYRTSR